MREMSNWSLSMGPWGGVRFRLHASFLVFGVLACYLSYLTEARLRIETSGLSLGLMALVVLFFSVLVHEIGHSLAARQVGGGVDTIVLGPLGGMHAPHVPHETQRELAVAAAGPLANLLAMLALTPALVLQDVDLGALLLQPLYPSGLLAGPLPLILTKLAFWMNWLLLAVNMIPAAPFDGGRALRSILWPVMRYRGATRVVSYSGMLIAFCLCVTSWFVYRADDTRVLPEWVPLMTLAIYLFFCARQEARKIEEDEIDDDLFGYDFSQGYTSLERPVVAPKRPNVFRRWLDQRRLRKAERLREIEAEEERRFDEVLIRVKELGMDSISPEERALMHRVSARYRSRMQH